jgi:RimJ/RimL family protein N-acetyltransferase
MRERADADWGEIAVEIVLENCRIRSWRWGDQESLARHANDRDVWINLRDRFPSPYTLADAESWLRLMEHSAPESQFAVAVGDEAIGSVGLVLNDDVARRSAEIGYWLGKAYWGRGIASAVVPALTDWAFAQFDVCRLFAGVFDGNAASARVLEKSGYVLEGRLRKAVTKDGKTIDQLLYAITR